MSFIELCPNWNKIIDSIDKLTTHDKIKYWTNVKRPSKCVVGEAWGYSDYYRIEEAFPIERNIPHCAKCTEFSTQFSIALSPAFYVKELGIDKEKINKELLKELEKRGIKIEPEAVGKFDINRVKELMNEFSTHFDVHG